MPIPVLSEELPDFGNCLLVFNEFINGVNSTIGWFFVHCHSCILFHYTSVAGFAFQCLPAH